MNTVYVSCCSSLTTLSLLILQWTHSQHATPSWTAFSQRATSHIRILWIPNCRTTFLHAVYYKCTSMQHVVCRWLERSRSGGRSGGCTSITLSMEWTAATLRLYSPIFLQQHQHSHQLQLSSINICEAALVYRLGPSRSTGSARQLEGTRPAFESSSRQHRYLLQQQLLIAFIHAT